VTAVFALIATLHVSVEAEEQPVQEAKVLLPAVAGAVNVTAVPAL
jgi:hypothetical protein